MVTTKISQHLANFARHLTHKSLKKKKITDCGKTKYEM